MSTAADLAERLESAAAIGDGDVLVDLSGVQFMDVAIVNTLVACRQQLALRSRRLTLRAPTQFARRVLDLCGLVDLVEPGSAVGARWVDLLLTRHGPG
jgi:anti-anti-sigma factor